MVSGFSSTSLQCLSFFSIFILGLSELTEKKNLFKQKYLSNVSGKKWRGTCQFEISFYLTFQLTSSTFEFSTCSSLPPEIQMFACSIASSRLCFSFRFSLFTHQEWLLQFYIPLNIVLEEFCVYYTVFLFACLKTMSLSAQIGSEFIL